MTREEILACLTDRPCTVCKFHSENGCGKWKCVFEQKPEETDTERLRKGIEWIMDEYQDEINRLEEDRRENRGIGFDDALTCGKIGAYGKAVADLKDLLEGEEE